MKSRQVMLQKIINSSSQRVRKFSVENLLRSRSVELQSPFDKTIYNFYKYFKQNKILTIVRILFYDSGFFQDCVGTIFIYCFDCFGRDGQGEVFFELWHIHTLFLQVRIFANLTCWVEFGSTNNVGVPSCHN